MSEVRIEADGRAPSDIQDSLEKAFRATEMTLDRDFDDPAMQSVYEETMHLIDRAFDAMADEIEALR